MLRTVYELTPELLRDEDIEVVDPRVPGVVWFRTLRPPNQDRPIAPKPVVICIDVRDIAQIEHLRRVLGESVAAGVSWHESTPQTPGQKNSAVSVPSAKSV